MTLSRKYPDETSPESVGVVAMPLSVPVAESIVSPGGPPDPNAMYQYGVPPRFSTVNVSEYGTPTNASGNGGSVLM